MPLGVIVQTRNAPPARGAPTQVDTAFVAVKATSGTVNTPIEVRSIADYVATFGARGAGNLSSYDWLDTFFREGGRRAYVSRYTGTGSDIDSALLSFSADLGAGLVAAPEETAGATTYGKLLNHAADTNRFALLDYANGDTVAAMTTLVGLIPATNADRGMTAGQWVNVPAPAGVIGGSARQVHGSAVTAALIARAQRQGNPNRAAAGRDFPLQYATSFTRDVNDADRLALLNAGGNTFATKYGIMQLYGFQTKVAQTGDSPFWQANAGIARMWLQDKAKVAGENYMFRAIDGQGRLATALKTDLEAIALELYEAGGLFGEDPSDAFSVEVGASVNTVNTIAQGELHAVMEARLSLHAKTVYIDLVSVPVTGQVSQPVA